MADAYSFKNKSLSFGNLVMDGDSAGFAEGSAIEVEPMGDSGTDKIGSGGEVVVSLGVDQRVKVSISLQQTSWANTELTAYDLAFRRQDPVFGGFQDFSFTDTDTGATVLAGQAYITKPAAASFAAESGTRKWEFHLVSVSAMSLPGNLVPAVPPSDIVEAMLPDVAAKIAVALQGGTP